MLSITPSSRSLIYYSASSNILLILSSVFFLSVIESFISDWFFFIFSNSLLKLSLRSSTLFSNPVNIFMTITLNSLRHIVYFHFTCLFCCYFVLFFHLGHSPLVSFYLTLCVSFHVLGRSAISPSCANSALYKRGPMMPCTTMSPGHQNQALQGCLFRGLCMFYCCGWAALAFI